MGSGGTGTLYRGLGMLLGLEVAVRPLTPAAVGPGLHAGASGRIGHVLAVPAGLGGGQQPGWPSWDAGADGGGQFTAIVAVVIACVAAGCACGQIMAARPVQAMVTAAAAMAPLHQSARGPGVVIVGPARLVRFSILACRSACRRGTAGTAGQIVPRPAGCR